MMALGKPLDPVGSHLPGCRPSGYFSSEDFLIPKWLLLSSQGTRDRNSHMLECLVEPQPSPALER